MDIFETISHRRSIRQYQPGFKIPESDLNRILESAMLAPSAMNKQPWQFLIAQDEAILSKIKTVHPYCSFLTDAGTGILVCVDKKREYNQMGIIDVSLAAQNILLAAHALGYGTCYCGVYPDHTEKMQGVLNLPEHIEPIGLIVIGKPAQSLAERTAIVNRFNPDFIHYNHW